MKFLVVACALICAVAARPQFGGPGFGGFGGPGFGGPQFGGSSSNAAAGTQTFK